MKKLMSMTSCLLFFLFQFCCIVSEAGELLSLVPRNTRAVIRTDLTKMGSLANIHSGDKGGEALLQLTTDLPSELNAKQHCTEIVASAVSLHKSNYLIFCKTALAEKTFTASLLKTNKFKITPLKKGKNTLYRITSTFEQKTFYACYLRKDILLFSTKDPSWYFNDASVKKGLTATQRSYMKEGMFISGFALPDRKFYKKNPMLPGFRFVRFHTQIHKDGAVTFSLQGTLKAGEDAKKRTLQLQQSLLVGAIFLNSVEPTLAEDFIKNGVFYDQDNSIYYRQYFSASFLKKLYEKIPALLVMGREMVPPRQRKGKE